jgi:pyruvate dehydrogenase complex dehydrogenase (E1) component
MMNESLKNYLQNKKIYKFHGKSYYKAKSYKNNYYIEIEKAQILSSGTKEVVLEKNYRETKIKGMAKWSPERKKIMISESKIRSYYQAFDIEA